MREYKNMAKILFTICIIALNIWAFIGVTSYGDFIDIIYYPIVILSLTYIFYRYYPKFPSLFIFFNLLVVAKYFDSLNKVEGFPDKAMEDLYTILAYFLIHVCFVIVLNKVIKGRTPAEKKLIIIPMIISLIIFALAVLTLLWIVVTVLLITIPIVITFFILRYFIIHHTPIMPVLSSFIRQILGEELIQDKRIIVLIMAIFAILCYTPIISAPSSFVRQIIGAQLIQDDEADIHCVTKIDKNFICALGGIEKSSTPEDYVYYYRAGYAYDTIKNNRYVYYDKEYPSADNKYMYKRFFILDSRWESGWRGPVPRGILEPQLSNMKKYYIDINHFFFKLSKRFKIKD